MADGDPTATHLSRETWRRLGGAILSFAQSSVRGRAAALFASLLGLLLAISGLNVLNSYVGRDFMTAIEHRDRAAFLHYAMLYVVVFGASTAAAVLSRFAEERFGLLWRHWLTGRLIHFYLQDRTYLRLVRDDTLSNPDQRISEDVRTFVTMTVSLFLMALNATLTVLAFSGVLWSISRTLFVVGILYAAAGSLMTFLLGRRLVALNYAQADREADFRTALIEVREDAEAVALHRRERQLDLRLQDLLFALVRNMRRIIAVNRNVGFFTTGYNYMIQIIPALVVAPLFIRGEVEFGVITQSAMAFSLLLGAFSLIVTQFQTISSYAAVLARLSALAEGLQVPVGHPGGIDTAEDPNRVSYERLTLGAAGDEQPLVRDLNFEILRGARVLITSADPAARAALLRATAGVWSDGAGRVVRPPLEDMAFLPERAYLPPGTLREMVEGSDGSVPLDAELRSALAILDAADLVTQTASADRELDWERLLPLREQQALALARVLVTRPRFAFVDRLGETVGADRLALVFSAFAERGITCVVFGEDEPHHFFDAVLVVATDGTWTVAAGNAASAGRVEERP